MSISRVPAKRSVKLPSIDLDVGTALLRGAINLRQDLSPEIIRGRHSTLKTGSVGYGRYVSIERDVT
jgi:hypothetical protein